jgi:dTDP-4-amino-4,6-dideoxygalactose transaminase
MSDLIRLSQSCVGVEEKQAICEVLDEGYLGMGKQVQMFEKELENFFSNKVKVACVNTGTSALQLALQACGIGMGDEVLIPSITYLASFQATSATGAIPISCDISMKTGCLDIEDARCKITKKTKAIMYVHYASGLGDREALFLLAKQYNLRVIEDAAHSFGGYDSEHRVGAVGDLFCFSFDGIKNITCGEGGAIVSSDEIAIQKICDLRLLGVLKDTERRYSGQRSWEFQVEDQGWRYHMSNINAAIGRVQLKKLDNFAKKRRKLANLYVSQLSDFPVIPINTEFDTIVPHIFPVIVSDHHRDSLKSFLLENKIETGIHYKPNHLLKKYRSMDCPRSENFGENVLSLPLHVNLKENDIEKITSLIKKYYKIF